MASSLLFAGCSPDNDAGERQGKGDPDRDVPILALILDVERTSIAAYALGISRLRGDALDLARELADQERQHAERLERLIKDLGRTPHPAKPAEHYQRGFPSLADELDVLTLAIDVENTAIAAYLDALPKLSTGSLRATAAAIATNEAQHLSLLRDALDRPAVPDAFVTGEG